MEDIASIETYNQAIEMYNKSETKEILAKMIEVSVTPEQAEFAKYLAQFKRWTSLIALAEAKYQSLLPAAKLEGVAAKGTLLPIKAGPGFYPDTFFGPRKKEKT